MGTQSTWASSRFHCGWCLNLITYYPQVSFTGIIWLINSFAYTILICGSAIPSGLGHYDPLSSHEIDGVRKEKERLTAVKKKKKKKSTLRWVPRKRMTQFLRDQASDSEEVVTPHAGRNLPVKVFCYLTTVNLTAAV